MSRKLVSLLMLVCLVFGTVTFAIADQKFGFHEKGKGKQAFQMLQNKLGLSDDQIAKLKELMAEHRKDNQFIHSKVEVVLAELKVLVQTKDTKPAQYTAKLNELASLKAQMDAGKEVNLKAVKGVLRPEQQARFELLQRKMFGAGAMKHFDKKGSGKKGFGKKPPKKDFKKGFGKEKFNKDFGKKQFGFEGKFPEQLKKKFGLTDTQVQQLKDEAKKAMDETKDIQVKLEADYKDLSIMLKDKNTKPDQFTAKLNDIDKLKAQIKQVMEKHRRVMASIFTPEQQAKMEVFRMERMKKMGQGFGKMGFHDKKGKPNRHK